MDVMLDLETMGNGSYAAIIAIGAVKFIPQEKRIYDRFYSRVDLQSCVDAGLKIDASTVMWWLQQSEEARKQFDDPKRIFPNLKLALNGFSSWIQKQIKPDEREHTVWGNGATFDNVILTNAYNALGFARPWSYKGDRCYRTLRNLYPDVPCRHFGTAHRADHDAEAQALHLMDIWPKLRAN